jgi:riboflavin biosynthesis pyrimidine reductase
MLFNRLWPESGEVDIRAHLRDLELPGQATDDRPHLAVNFVASLDGRASFQGRSGALGDDGDRELFRALREASDAVMAGTSTMAVERYGRTLRDPAARERRSKAGRAPEPLACLLTRSGILPLEIPLFADPEARVVVFAGAPVDLVDAAAQVELVTSPPGELTFSKALQHLRREHDVRFLLCEGGPRVFGALLSEGLVDQLFLTLAPKLVGGGDDLPVSAGSRLPEPMGMRLGWVLERQGSLFLDYRRI